MSLYYASLNKRDIERPSELIRAIRFRVTPPITILPSGWTAVKFTELAASGLKVVSMVPFALSRASGFAPRQPR